MKFSEDHHEVRITLWEWSEIPILPQYFWRDSQTSTVNLNWLPRWPKTWKFMNGTDHWYLGHLHVGLTGRAYFYYPRIILCPTQKELAWIEEERYRIGYRYGGESFNRTPLLNIMPQEKF